MTDEDRSRYGAAAEAYLQAFFPDLVEDGDELLRRIDDTVAEIQRRLEDLREWADDIQDLAARAGQAPYTDARAKALEGLRERLQKVVGAILPKPEERKPTLEEAAAEVREDDLGLPPRVADAPRP